MISRRCGLLTLCAFAIAAAQQPRPPAKPKTRRLLLTVANLEKSVEFYHRLLGVDLEQARYRMGEAVPALYGAPGTVMEGATLKLPFPDSSLLLLEARPTANAPTPSLQDPGAMRLILEANDLSAIRTRLQTAHIQNLLPASKNTPPVILVRDPDGFFVEIHPQRDATPAAPHNIRAMRLGLTVRNTDAAAALYRDVLGCEAQIGAWTKPTRSLPDAVNLVRATYRRSTCTFSAGNYPLEFLEFRNPKTPPRNLPRSLQQPGAAIIEFIVAKSSYDATIAALKSHGAEFAVQGGPTAVISNRISVLLRSPDFVFIEPRSTTR